MKLVVAGSRGIKNYTFIAGKLEEVIEIYGIDTNSLEIVHGGARGVDHRAEDWARIHGVEQTVFEPDYKKYGSSYAPIQRNAEMAEYADILVAVWDGESRGTHNMITHMLARGKPLHVFVE